MTFNFKILLFFLAFAGITAKAQLHFDTLYQTAYLEAQFEKAKEEGDSLTLGIAAYHLSGHIEWFEGSHSKVVDMMTLSLECFAHLGDSVNYYRVKPNLAEYYINAKLFDEAEQILMETANYYDRKEDWLFKMHMISRLGNLYLKKGELAKARKYKKESYELNKIAKDTLMDILYLIDQSRLFQDVEKYDSAIIVSRQSLNLSNAIDRNKFAALSLFNIGLMNQYKNRLDTAIYYLKKAEKRDRPIDYSDLRLTCLRHLSQCFEYKKDFENAHHYLSKYAALNDSILNKNRIEALDEITLAYETKEKQAAIDLLEKEKILSEQSNTQKSVFIYVLSALLALLAILIGFLIRFYREKINNEKIITNQQESLNQQTIQGLEKEMQLTSVKSMLEGQERERVRIARDLHDSLGGLLSTIKLKIDNHSEEDAESIGDLLDKAASEVRLIAQNLQPSALEQLGLIPALKDLINRNISVSSGSQINFQYYNIPPDLKATTSLQIYRIVQEALNNALKHAAAKEILIQINGEETGLSVLIEDDGVGFDLQKVSKGNGLENIRKRAEFLQAEMSIESSEKGTSIFIRYPYV